MSDLAALATTAVDAAGAAGADSAEAWVERSSSRQIRVYDGAVESLSDAGGRGLGVRAFVGGRTGYAYGTDLTEDGIRAIAARAHELAAVADEDEYAGLPDGNGAGPPEPIDGLVSSDTWTTDAKVELALATDRAARSREGVSQVEETLYADSEGEVAVANSNGLAAGYEATSAWAYSSAFAGEGDDLMTALGIGVGRGPGDLDPEAIGHEAADRALALKGARQPSSRRCPVILDAFTAASFVGFIGAMLSADSVQRGRSLFAGRVGDEVADGHFALTDDGRAPLGPSSAPFDGEGTPTRRTSLIEGGRLQGYLYDTRTARKEGGEAHSTGNAGRGSYRGQPSVGTTNLVIEPGTATLEELAREAGEGLLVTSVAGLHSGVNPVSGTFSVGATGRLIENGELGAPVREITIASDLVSMLRAVRAVGGEPRWMPLGGSVRAVPLLIGEMAVAGS